MKTTVRRNGTVRVWDIYQQAWLETTASALVAGTARGDAIMSSLTEKERRRIESAAARAQA